MAWWPALAILPVMCMLAAVSYAEAQQTEGARHKSLEVFISGNDATVKHVLKDAGGERLLAPVPGNVTGLKVSDAAGNGLEFAWHDGRMVVPPSEDEVVVEYALNDIMRMENDVWVWDFLYLHTTLFTFDMEGFDTIYADGHPVYLGEGGGIRCHGCHLRLEYAAWEPVTHHDIVWEENRFVVAVRSHDRIESVRLDQPAMSLNVEAAGGGRPITATIPVEMLGGPYHAMIGDEGILLYEQRSNATHVWVGARPAGPGTVSIVGATVIPEFGGMVLVMAAAMASVLVVLHKRSDIFLASNRR